jgi:hypothetical protein
LLHVLVLFLQLLLPCIYFHPSETIMNEAVGWLKSCFARIPASWRQRFRYHASYISCRCEYPLPSSAMLFMLLIGQCALRLGCVDASMLDLLKMHLTVLLFCSTGSRPRHLMQQCHHCCFVPFLSIHLSVCAVPICSKPAA